MNIVSLSSSASAAAALSSNSAIKMNEKQQQQQQQTFPFKLYEMLEYARASGYSSSISWLADGTGFVIHDKDAMMNDITPMFFKHTKFRSFVSVLILTVTAVAVEVTVSSSSFDFNVARPCFFIVFVSFLPLDFAHINLAYTFSRHDS